MYPVRFLRIFVTVVFYISLAIPSSSLQVAASSRHVWERPGCHKVGHTRRVNIPDCVQFHVTTNACRGYCESWSIPSTWEALAKNPAQVVTSVGQCCNIMETEEVSVRVMCVDGPRDISFTSAKSCSCFHCKKE